MKKHSKIIFASALLASFLGASLTIYVKNQPYSLANATEIHIDFKGTAPVMGAAANWEGVRGVAKFLRDTTKGIDNLLVSVATYLNGSSSLATFPIGTNFLKYTVATVNLATNNRVNGVTSYNKKLEICVGSKSAKALELLFNDASSPTGAGGVVTWKPQLFDSSLTSSALIRCDFGLASGNKRMICSWNGSGASFDAAGVMDAAMLSAIDDATTSKIKVGAIAKTKSITISTSPCAATQVYYYGLFFVADKASPHYSSAAFGLANAVPNATTVFQFCGVNHGMNYGTFNTSATGYFVSDSASPASPYPTAAEVTAVKDADVAAGANLQTMPTAHTFEDGTSCP